MSQKEINRLEIIQRLEAKQINQITAASRLALTTRQVRELQKRYREHGAAGLIRAFKSEVRQTPLPTLRNAAEKLQQAFYIPNTSSAYY